MAETPDYFTAEHRRIGSQGLQHFGDPEQYPPSTSVQPVAFPEAVVEPIPDVTPLSQPSTEDTFYQGNRSERSYKSSPPGSIHIPVPSTRSGSTSSSGTETPSQTPSFSGEHLPPDTASVNGVDNHFATSPDTRHSRFSPGPSADRPLSSNSRRSQNPHLPPLHVPTLSELAEEIESPDHRRVLVEHSNSGSGEVLSPRSELLSPIPETPAPRRHHKGKERERHRSRHHHHHDNGQVSAKELIQLIVNEEYKARQTRSLLDATNAQLANEQQRVITAQNTVADLLQQLRSANEARMLAERDAQRITEELRLYRLQYDNAQKEILRAQSIVDRAQAERQDAEAAAVRAKDRAQKWRDEHVYTRARDEGRRQGFKEGMEFGRRIGFSDGRDKGYKDGARDMVGKVLDEPYTPETQSETSQPPVIEGSDATRDIHGGDGTFSPVGGTRPGLNSTGADAVLAGAAYMPAAHEELRETPSLREPQRRVPPDSWVPRMDENGFIGIPAPNELGPRPVSPSDSLGANPMLNPSNSNNLFRQRAPMAAPSPAMHVREFGSMNTVPDPTSVFSPQNGRAGVPRDRLSIVPSLVHGDEEDGASRHSSRHSKGTILARARRAFGGGYASSQPATIAEDEGEGWTDIGTQSPAPSTADNIQRDEGRYEPQREARQTPAQSYASIARERMPHHTPPQSLAPQHTGSQHPRISTATSSVPAISVVAPSSDQRSMRSAARSRSEFSSTAHGPRSTSPNLGVGGAYYVAPSPIRHPNVLDNFAGGASPSPSHRTIKLDTPPQGTPIQPPIVIGDPSKHSPTLSTAPSLVGHQIRRVPSAASMASRVSRGSYKPYNPEDDLDPAFLVSSKMSRQPQRLVV